MTAPKPSLRAEKAEVRDRMQALGFGPRDIAIEFSRRYKLRPRTAWRESLGWTLREAAAQINTYAGQTGLDPDGACPMSASHLADAESWPGEGTRITGRRPRPYLLALLAAVYEASVPELMDLADREHMPAGDLLVLEKYSQSTPVTICHPPAPHLCPPDPAVLDRLTAARGWAVTKDSKTAEASAPLSATRQDIKPVSLTYRWMQEPPSGESWVEREVTMMAHEGSEHAERAEGRDIDDVTIEQLRAEVTQLSAAFMTAEPLPALLEMRQLRNRIYGVLDRRMYPSDTTELYLLCGVLSCLMAVAVSDLGFPQSAEELTRAGWAYATVIDHRPLMAHLRLLLAGIACWNRPRQARDLASSGLRYLADGPNAAQLHLQHARASARLGDGEAAQAAVAAADEAREREHHDELLDMGGEFGFSFATHDYMAGSALLDIPSAQGDAMSRLERATERYAAGPGPGEHHGYASAALAHVDLAVARLRCGQLDGAALALGPVLSLPPAKRIDALAPRLSRIRAELASGPYTGSAQAAEIDERIEAFSRDTVVSALHELPAGSA
jgi:hypothetical protein